MNQDGTLNTPSNPAARGSVIQIFGTGMGPYDRNLMDGSIVGPPLANLTNPVHATLSGSACGFTMFGLPCVPPSFPATVLFAGAAPLEVVGVDQINVLIPSTAIARSAMSLTLQIGAVSTRASVSIK